MSLPRVYVTRNDCPSFNYLSEENLRMLRAFSDPVVEETCDGNIHLSEDELIQRMSGARAILMPNWSGNGEITERVLREVGTVEVITRAHSGPSSVEAVAGECGIQYSEGSNAIDLAVAEWTIATAIMGRRKLLDAGRSLKEEGTWQKDWRQASMLLGSTVGLIGLGRIGRIVTRYFKTLGTKVIAYDKYVDCDDAARLGVTLVSLDDLLCRADVLSLHAPVTPETTGMLGAREFGMLRDGAVFLNSARAALYDEMALVEELRKGRFSAFLDVYSKEPLDPAHPLRELDNVFLSSHIAGTNDAMYKRAGAETIETLRLYFETGVLRDMRKATETQA